jgi:hypothetical protein
MKHYNSFSPEQRMKAHHWLVEQWESGAKEKPSKCCACGQDKGVIDAHAEDYSEPFGNHTDQYHLCFTCHMMVHCRFNAKRAWTTYKNALKRGVVFNPFYGRNFPDFKKQFLEGNLTRGFQTMPFVVGKPELLDEIDSFLSNRKF